MSKYNNFIENYKYRTNYFESFSEYINCSIVKSEFVLNIICFNIRSINAHFDELLLFLENYLNCKNIDILILTETWHDPFSCHYDLPGYKFLFSGKKRNQNDGIIIFVK